MFGITAGDDLNSSKKEAGLLLLFIILLAALIGVAAGLNH